MAEDLELVEIQVETLATLGLCVQNEPEQSIQYLEKAARLADKANLPRQATRVHNNLSIQYLLHNADMSKAMQETQTAALIAHQVGDRDGELFYRSNHTAWQIIQGHIKEVERDLPALKEINDSLAGEGAGSLNYDQMNNLLMMARGDFDQALDYSHSNLEEIRQIGDLQRLESTLEIIILIAIITNDLTLGKQTAEEYFHLATNKLASAAGANNQLSIIYSRLGDIALAREHYEIATQETKTSMRGNYDRMWNDWAECELLLVEKKMADAWEAFKRLYMQVLNYQFTWHANMLKMEWGFALLQHGDQVEREEGRRILEEASETFEHMNATGYVEFIQEKMPPK